MHPFRFEVATEPWQFEQIHRLNYRTFVEEIPQHTPNPTRALVDQFHNENTYVICLQGRNVVGMLTVRDQRPFSLDLKIDNLDSFLPVGRRLCEVRLLSVEPGYRHGDVFLGLLNRMGKYCLERNYDTALISGTVRQFRLYRHLGFVPFGPLVGAPDSRFQPMYLTREAFLESTRHLFNRVPRSSAMAAMLQPPSAQAGTTLG